MTASIKAVVAAATHYCGHREGTTFTGRLGTVHLWDDGTHEIGESYYGAGSYDDPHWLDQFRRDATSHPAMA